MGGDLEELGEGLYSPQFRFGLPRRSLHELATWANGLAFKDINFSKTGLPVVKIAEVKNGIGPDTKRTLGIYDDAIRLADGDLLFCWSGQPESSIGTFQWWGGPAWLNQHIFKVQPSTEISFDYLHALLRFLQPNFVRIAQNKQTTGLGHVTKGDLRQITVQVPSRLEQDRIAALIKPLDDKIELNRRIAGTLEATARTLFKSWFVDFDPVHAKAEGRPTSLADDLAELFPSGFGEDGLPEGWTFSTVGGLFEVSGGNTPSTAEPENWDGRHQWATPKDLSGIAYPVLLQTERRISDVGLARSTSGLLPAGSLLLSSRAPIGYMAFASLPVAINQGFAGFVRRDVSTAYAWGWCSENIDVIRGNAGGSTFPEISKSVLRGLRMLKPPNAILAAFDDAVAPIVARLIDAAEQSETLAALRDTLLPKLISGELRIRDAERAVAAA